MFAELLLRDARPELVKTADDAVLRIMIRLNWYRSVPLSCVEEIDLRLDGQQLIDSRATLTVSGKTVAVSSLAEAEDVWWFPLEQALLTAALPAGLATTNTNTLTYGIRTRIPYFLPRPDGSWGTLNDTAKMEVRL